MCLLSAGWSLEKESAPNRARREDIKITLRWQRGKYNETTEDRRNKEMERGMEERDVGTQYNYNMALSKNTPST